MMKLILVVDDDSTILDLLRETLPALGYQADFANGGPQAMQCIKAQDYDLILADISMPQINGIDVARAAARQKPYVPIIFMSGNPNTIVEERSFLAKPFTIDQLETKIQNVLTENSDEDPNF